MSGGPMPLEWCSSYHCPGDCGLLGHGAQHKGHDERSAFEKWYGESGREHLSMRTSYGYVAFVHQDMWEAWQARAAIA